MRERFKIETMVRAFESDDDVEGACADAACFLREVHTGKSVDGVDDYMSNDERAQAARWLAESALALALHFEAKIPPSPVHDEPLDGYSLEHRLDTFVGRRRKTIAFHVAPRYSSGSPAMVPARIAWDVATNERDGYKNMLDGVQGDKRVEFARREGLDRIVVCAYELGKHWHVFDMITGEISKLRCSHTTSITRRVRPGDGDRVEVSA